MKEKIASLRNEYTWSDLDESSVIKNPFLQFQKWLEEAINSQILEPNAMVISTVSAQGIPSSRTVLLKGVDREGFTFYTNYGSKKAKEIVENPVLSLLFPWLELERQVIISGIVEKVSQENSEAYFYSRPKGSQIGAWISNQSEEIPSRKSLELKLMEMEEQFEGEKVPFPDNWGGYKVIPSSFEFWQGRKNRLHDRIFFQKTKNESWKISRLSP